MSLLISHLEFLIEIIATLAFACSGLIAGARKKMDFVGICVMSGLSAFGGGTLRDILLDRRPFFWVENPHWLWAMILMSLLAMMFMRDHHLKLTEKAILIPDAVGLGLYAALGAQIAFSQGLPAIVAALMGMTSAVFGGVLRDICCNEIPKVFKDHQPYAVIAFLGGWFMMGLSWLGLSEWISITLAAFVTTLLRLLAIRFAWVLPKWKIKGH
jgi:uncharacterized membrane protein YeiH